MQESTKNEMLAVVTAPMHTGRLLLQKMPIPIPAANQAFIKVNAFSLNQGETRTALDATNR